MTFFPLSHPQEFLIYFLFLFCNCINLKRSLLVSCGFLQQPFQSRLICCLRTKPVEKRPLRHSGSPKWKYRWCPGVGLHDKPASAFLSLSLFIQWVLSIPRKSKAVELQGTWLKFSHKAPAKRTSFLGKCKAGETEGDSRWEPSSKAFSGVSMGHPRHRRKDGPCSPAGFQLHGFAFPTTPPAPGHAHTCAE